MEVVCGGEPSLLHFTLCATKIISSRKIHCSRTNFYATKTSSRRIRRVKIVKKDFARPSFFIGRAKWLCATKKYWSRKVTLRDEKILVAQSNFARRKNIGPAKLCATKHIGRAKVWATKNIRCAKFCATKNIDLAKSQKNV